MLFKSLLILTVYFVGLAISESTETSVEPLTTIQPNVTNTTTMAPTTPVTTSASDVPTVLNFTIPKNSNDTCLILQFAIDMTIKYTAEDGDNLKNASLTVPLPAKFNDYNGVCDDQFNSFRLFFWNNWTLDLNFTLSDERYELSTILLNYYINSTWFPMAAPESTGFHTANATNLHDFSAIKGSSYRCSAKTMIDLDSFVSFEITHYQGEPFYTKDQNKEVKFHTAVDCPADQTGTSKLVPIIVGSALAFLVVLVLIAYLIGRRRHRSGYQSV